MADSDKDSGAVENNGSNDKEGHGLLPLNNVSRIIKKALPANANIPKEAKELMQECASEFIGFITSEASDKCLHEKRMTINGDDLLWAMSALGFDNYIDPLKLYLHKFRELEGCLTGAPGDGGSASSSSSSQPTDVLSTGGAGSDRSGMMVMGQELYGGSPMSGSLYQHQQHQLGSGLFPGNSGSGSDGGSGGSSSPSGKQGRI